MSTKPGSGMQRFSRYNTLALFLAIIASAESAPAQTSQFTHMNPLYFTMLQGGPTPQPQIFTVTSTGFNFDWSGSVQSITSTQLATVQRELFCGAPVVVRRARSRCPW